MTARRRRILLSVISAREPQAIREAEIDVERPHRADPLRRSEGQEARPVRGRRVGVDSGARGDAVEEEFGAAGRVLVFGDLTQVLQCQSDKDLAEARESR